MSSDAISLFIGAPVSLRSVRALSTAAADLRDRAPKSLSLRWVSPTRYHVTLKYLGWCKPEIVPALRDSVGAALRGARAIDMRCRELDAFPKASAARVLWAGIDDRMGELGALAKAIDSACAELGFNKDVREFHPHVTLARCEGPSDVESLLSEAPVRVFSKTVLDRLLLYKSSVESKTSEYEILADWALEPSS